MMRWKEVMLLLLMAVLGRVEPARFLAFFHLPSPSIHFVYRPVLEALAARGHQVVYVTPFPYKEVPQGIQQIVLRKYDYEDEFDINYADMGRLSTFGMVRDIYKFGADAGRMSLPTKEVQDLIHSKDQRFDAVLLEPCFGQEYLSAFVHKFNAIGIEILTLGDNSWTNELAGLPDNPAFQRDMWSQMPREMDFFQRLQNTYHIAVSTLLGYYFLRTELQPLMDLYFNYTGWETRPPIEVLAKNRSLILANYNHLLGYPYPSPPHRKDIGGINIRPTNPLPKEIQQFMDESQNGVIYMALGSHVKAAKSPKKIAIFMDVFKDLPQRVLLKYETKYPGKVPANVKISNWFPQQDILAHKNCILFITHGGLLSTTEAVYHGVPIIGLPFFADQYKNVIYAEEVGFGRMLRLEELSEETVARAIHEVLTNKSHKEVAMKRSEMFKDRRHSPAEEAVYWIEYSLRYPFALTPKSTSLSAIELHLLDVKAFILSVLALTLYTLSWVYCIVRRKLRSLFGQKKLKVN